MVYTCLYHLFIVIWMMVYCSCPTLSVKDSHGLPRFPTRAFHVFFFVPMVVPSLIPKHGAMCFAVSRNWRTQTKGSKGNSNPTTDEFPGISCASWGSPRKCCASAFRCVPLQHWRPPDDGPEDGPGGVGTLERLKRLGVNTEKLGIV